MCMRVARSYILHGQHTHAVGSLCTVVVFKNWYSKKFLSSCVPAGKRGAAVGVNKQKRIEYAREILQKVRSQTNSPVMWFNNA